MTATIGNFTICEKLGEGMFGIVYSGKCNKTNRDVAIKIEKEQDFSTSLVKHEAKVLLALKGCQGVPPLLGYGTFHEHRYIVLPLFDVSLFDKIKQSGKLNGLDGLLIHKQVKQILTSIHKRGFIHRDVKPDNIMLDSENNIYLIDYGCATNYKRSQTPSATRSYVGTYEYLGELGKRGIVCPEVDFESLDKTMESCIV